MGADIYWNKTPLGGEVGDDEIDAVMEWAKPEGDDPEAATALHSAWGVQGGFKWSSQHLSVEVFDGTATWVDGDVDGASGDAVAGPAASAPRCRAGVLGEDCRGFVE
jgi:hypothetical protein